MSQQDQFFGIVNSFIAIYLFLGGLLTLAAAVYLTVGYVGSWVGLWTF